MGYWNEEVKNKIARLKAEGNIGAIRQMKTRFAATQSNEYMAALLQAERELEQQPDDRRHQEMLSASDRANQIAEEANSLAATANRKADQANRLSFYSLITAGFAVAVAIAALYFDRS